MATMEMRQLLFGQRLLLTARLPLEVLGLVNTLHRRRDGCPEQSILAKSAKLLPTHHAD